MAGTQTFLEASMDDEFSITIPARRTRWVDLAVVGVDLIARLAGAVEAATDNLVTLAAQHANHMREQERMREQAAREIEALVSGEPG